MLNSHRRRVALAGILAVTAIGGAAPAHADPKLDCDARLEQLEARFYEVAEKRGYEAATEWWEVHWKRYYERCLAP